MSGNRFTSTVPVRVLSILAAAALLPAGAVSARGLTPSRLDSVFDHMAPAARATVLELERRLDAMRSLLASDSYVDQVAAVIARGRTMPFDVPAPVVPSAADLRAVRSLPLGLREPVAGLVAAAQEVDRIVGPVDDDDLAAEMRRLQSVPPAPPRPPSPPRRPVLAKLLKFHDALDRYETRLPRPKAASPSPFARTMLPRTQRAALLMAAALDEYLPALRAAAPVRAGRRAAGCDLLDALPALCIGSDAQNTYDENAALLVDMGGDDTYKNSAGADFTSSENVFFNNVVNVDLAGDDVYDADPKIANHMNVQVPTRTILQTTTTSQGVGYAGLGLLLDEEGDDSYTATALPPLPDTGMTIFTQGSALAGGTGLLLDRAGNDSYLARIEDKKGLVEDALYAQASGNGGTPALVDSGGGNDTYVVDGGAVTQDYDSAEGTDATMRRVHAQAFGPATLSDDGGKDAFRIGVRSTFIPATDDYTRIQLPMITLQGQGHGEGYLLEGAGDTEYTVETIAQGGAQWTFEAQAAGYETALSDLGGDDRYSATVSTEFSREYRQTDACLCEAAEVVVGNVHNLMFETIGVQAVGEVAVIDDRGGNDTYDVSIDHDYRFSLRDQLKKPAYPPLMRVDASTIATSLVTQGIGDLTGFGRSAAATFILDRGEGADRYVTERTTDAVAEVLETRWKGKPDMRLTTGQWGSGKYQGYVTGTEGIIDEGGDGDEFRVTAGSTGTTRPDPDASLEPGSGSWPRAQGAVVALGTDPVIVKSSSTPACPGFHGFDRWGACQPNGATDPDHDVVEDGSGEGYAPEAAATPASLKILESPPSAAADPRAETRFPVTAQLLAPDGGVLKGAPLHFDLMTGSVTTTPAGDAVPPVQWRSLYQENAKTNKKGIAKVKLPLYLVQASGDDLIPDPTTLFTVEVTFDGTDDRYPSHAAAPIDIKPPGPNAASLRRYVY